MKKRKPMKLITFLLTICIMLLMSTSAFAIPTNSQDSSSIPPQIQGYQAHQPIINPPPSGWNALTASDEELAKYNYPPRPTDAKDLSDWKNIVKGTWIYPEFKVSTSGRIAQLSQTVPNMHPKLPPAPKAEKIQSFTSISSNHSTYLFNWIRLVVGTIIMYLFQMGTRFM